MKKSRVVGIGGQDTGYSIFTMQDIAALSWVRQYAPVAPIEVNMFASQISNWTESLASPIAGTEVFGIRFISGHWRRTLSHHHSLERMFFWYQWRALHDSTGSKAQWWYDKLSDIIMVIPASSYVSCSCTFHIAYQADSTQWWHVGWTAASSCVVITYGLGRHRIRPTTLLSNTWTEGSWTETKAQGS